MFFVAYWRSRQATSIGPTSFLRLRLLGASVHKNKYTYIFFSRPRRAFFKIVLVCGLYDEMECSDENRTLGSWILARNFLETLF